MNGRHVWHLQDQVRGGKRGEGYVCECVDVPSDTESSEEEEAKPMTVRFARHGNKSEMDPSPSPCEEEWVPLHPVAFEVRVCAAASCGRWWQPLTAAHLVWHRMARQTL